MIIEIRTRAEVIVHDGSDEGSLELRTATEVMVREENERTQRTLYSPSTSVLSPVMGRIRRHGSEYR